MKGWVAKCKELGIPVSETVTLCGTLANPVEVREWMLAGLPSDGTSVDNGILVTRGKRWPLMIDPQVRGPNEQLLQQGVTHLTHSLPGQWRPQSRSAVAPF